MGMWFRRSTIRTSAVRSRRSSCTRASWKEARSLWRSSVGKRAKRSTTRWNDMPEARRGLMLLPRGLPGFACLVVFLVLLAVPSSGPSQPGGGTGIQGQSGGAVSTEDGSGGSTGDLSTQQQVRPSAPPSRPPRRVITEGQTPAPGGPPTAAAPPTSPAQVSPPAQQGTPSGGAPTPVPVRPSRRLAPTQQPPAPSATPGE